MSLEHNLDELDAWLTARLAALTPSEQSKLLRKVGQDLRRENTRRMTAQTAPDGSLWANRKTVKGSIGGSGRPRGRRNPHPQRGNPELKFRYDGATVHLKSYEDEGRTLLGFDLITCSIKRYRKDRIDKPKGKPKKMMRKLRTGRHLRLRIIPGELRLGFTGRDARLARIHHYGLRDRLQYGIAQYPARELIGISTQDEALIRNSILRHLENPA